MKIFEFIEDYDNDFIPEQENKEIMEEKVEEYNETYRTLYDPVQTVKDYYKLRNSIHRQGRRVSEIPYPKETSWQEYDGAFS